MFVLGDWHLEFWCKGLASEFLVLEIDTRNWRKGLASDFWVLETDTGNFGVKD